jgi:hypothetical protein
MRMKLCPYSFLGSLAQQVVRRVWSRILRMATTHVHYYNHHSENKTFTQRGRVEVLCIHRKKKVREFPVPSRDVTTKLSLGGNNDVIIELFLPRGSLVSDIPAGEGKLVNLFYGVLVLRHTVLTATAVESQYRMLSNPEREKRFVNTKLIKMVSVTYNLQQLCWLSSRVPCSTSCSVGKVGITLHDDTLHAR